MGESEKFRYEFRVFGPDLATVSEALKAHLGARGDSESSCVYLLGAGDASSSLKIRGSCLESKVLLQTTDAGLEQWRPDIAEPFPLDPRVCRRLFDIHCDEALSARRLLAEIGPPKGPVTCMHVRKRRQHFERGEVMGERCELLVNGARVESVAVEGTSATAVQEVRAALGLNDANNANYVQALKRISGLVPLSEHSPWRFDAARAVPDTAKEGDE